MAPKYSDLSWVELCTYSVCQHLFSLGVSRGSGLMTEIAGLWLNPQKAYLYALEIYSTIYITNLYNMLYPQINQGSLDGFPYCADSSHFQCSLLVAPRTIALSMNAARTTDAEVDVKRPAPGSECVICKSVLFTHSDAGVSNGGVSHQRGRRLKTKEGQA